MKLNLHYFGFTGLKLPILVYRGVRLVRLKGKIELSSFKRGTVKLGYVASKKEPVPQGLQSIFFIEEGGILSLGEQVKIFSGFDIAVRRGSKFSIGSQIMINQGFQVHAYRNVTIESNCVISFSVFFNTNDFHSCIINGVKSETKGEIYLSKCCWIGHHVTILKGVSLAPLTVVGCHSVISKSVLESGVVVVGNNKIVKRGISAITGLGLIDKDNK